MSDLMNDFTDSELNLDDLPDDDNVWQYASEESDGESAEEAPAEEKEKEDAAEAKVKDGWTDLTAKKTILALDDVNLHLIRISEILSHEFDVRIAKTPRAALKILGSMNIDLMLIDIEMPEMSGFEFLALVKSVPAKVNIPAIFVTAHATEEFVRKAATVGAVNYVVKPYERESLEKKVHDALGIKSD
ncbi:MAG: response regulator [Synergistaceae bacterium]|nr:response regulator [Synergistaceae bacterium]